MPSMTKITGHMKFIRTYACLLGLITAGTIFFQLHVDLPGGQINLNLADPFALLALITLCLSALLSRQIPQWRIAEFNWILVIFSGLLLFGYTVGWMKIGATQWALSARLIGWVVLLGYLSAGYLLVAYVGAKGIRRLLEALAASAILVVLWNVAARLLYGYGVPVPDPTPNFEGFSGNRNAFAFQLLAVLALSLPYSKVYARQLVVGEKGILTAWRSWVPVGFLIAGILWSASRAGMMVAATILLLAFLRNTIDRKAIFWGVLCSALLWATVWMLQNPRVVISPIISAGVFFLDAIGSSSADRLALIGQSVPTPNADIQSLISSAQSNHERWATLLYGFEMWRHSPLIGEGLGVFIANSAELFGHPTVIHNTPLWILAEFGLLGAVVSGWSFLKLTLYAVKPSSSANALARSALLLLLTLFLVFSQFHEMLFQRIFWLVGGALLAVPQLHRPKSLVEAN